IARHFVVSAQTHIRLDIYTRRPMDNFQQTQRICYAPPPPVLIIQPSLSRNPTVSQRPIRTDTTDAILSLRKSEVKVAEYVLKSAQQVIHMRIVDLAQEAQVSEPTIVRFCRAIGCNGFQEFKVRIAQEMAVANNIGQFAIAEDDSIGDICDKIADTTIQ